MPIREPNNPFDNFKDSDRHFIWQRLIIGDSEAFAAGDWTMIEDDFDVDRFEGLRAMNSNNPDDWQIIFPTLASYRESWLVASVEFRKKKFVGLTCLEAVYARCRINRIVINEDRAIAIKKFSGTLECEDGSIISGDRQTVYRLHRMNDQWKIVGFVGFLPYSPSPAK